MCEPGHSRGVRLISVGFAVCRDRTQSSILLLRLHVVLNWGTEETGMEATVLQTTAAADRSEDEVAALWSRIRDHLEYERRRIAQEIRAYPTPIAACDAQFNHLLEERATISQELQRAREAIERGRGGATSLELLAELARASRHLD